LQNFALISDSTDSTANLGDHSLDLSLGNSSSNQNDTPKPSIDPHHSSSSSAPLSMEDDWQRTQGFRRPQVRPKFPFFNKYILMLN